MLPEPVHPAIVHFPIVLLLLGSVSAILSLFVLNRTLFTASTVFFVLGAIGAYYAVQTGDVAADAFLNAFPNAGGTLDIHAGWADWTYRLSIAAAVFGILATVTFKWNLLMRVFKVLTCAVAVIIAYYVYNTGHVGGYMVYHDALNLRKEQSIKSAPFTSMSDQE